MLLENCARWHMEQSERFVRLGDEAKAERHDIIAFVLYRTARDIRATPKGPEDQNQPT